MTVGSLDSINMPPSGRSFTKICEDIHSKENGIPRDGVKSPSKRTVKRIIEEVELSRKKCNLIPCANVVVRLDSNAEKRNAASKESIIGPYFTLVDMVILRFLITALCIWNADELGVIHVESKTTFITNKEQIRKQKVN
jgi:hypothetical protein